MNSVDRKRAIGRRTAWAYSVLLLLSLAASALPQQPPSSRESIAVNYVMVPFVALDDRGRPIQDLREKDVDLLVDGVPASFDMFERAYDAPVSYSILLDVSGSMALAGKMAGARTAVNALVATRKRGDDFSLWAFADGEVSEVVPFTENTGEIMTAVLQLEPYGKTAFHDALAKMPDKTILGKNGSRAIILMTDALDNASTITRQELTRLLESVDVPIYPLGLRPRSALEGQLSTPEHYTDIELLEELARISGGRAFITNNLVELESGIAAIQRDLRSQYLIGFAPTGRGSVRFRKIALKISGKKRIVRVRAGYRGTEPPAMAVKKNPRSNASAIQSLSKQEKRSL